MRPKVSEVIGIRSPWYRSIISNKIGTNVPIFIAAPGKRPLWCFCNNWFPKRHKSKSNRHQEANFVSLSPNSDLMIFTEFPETNLCRFVSISSCPLALFCHRKSAAETICAHRHSHSKSLHENWHYCANFVNGHSLSKIDHSPGHTYFETWFKMSKAQFAACRPSNPFQYLIIRPYIAKAIINVKYC